MYRQKVEKDMRVHRWAPERMRRLVQVCRRNRVGGCERGELVLKLSSGRHPRPSLWGSTASPRRPAVQQAKDPRDKLFLAGETGAVTLLLGPEAS